jgi:PhoPQ-activated pathogenicity-related protein
VVKNVARAGTPIVALTLLLCASLPAQHPVKRSDETALDRYIAAPDSNFSFRKAGMLAASTGVTASILELTSQRWLTTKEVDRPLWRHWLIVYRPVTVTRDVGLLFISGGSNDGKRPSKANAVLAGIARDTGTVTAELRMVPNQPLTFTGDTTHTARSEDEIIAYTWDRFLRNGDDRWPLRLPMTKAAVRAMDAVTAWTATPQGGGKAVRRFVLAGGSKRGWTTWTAAAVDRRVVAIVPAVIDLLNIAPSFKHHWQAYGFWAPAVADYERMGIMRWLETPQFAALMTIEDPWSYRARLTMPKLMLNAAGDQFFLPDSSQFYFEGLPGEKYLRYVPNTDHSLDASTAFETLQAFYAAIVADMPRPRFSWTVARSGRITVRAATRPVAVRLWQATNPKARDFRLETLGPKWTMTTLSPTAPNTWTTQIEAPRKGWTAAFVELTFAGGSRFPLTFTTEVVVTPDRLPYPYAGSDAVKRPAVP